MCCHDEKSMHVNETQGNREEQLLLLTAVFCPLPLIKATEQRLYVAPPLGVYPLHYLYSEIQWQVQQLKPFARNAQTQSRDTVKIPDPKSTGNTGKNLVNISELCSTPDAPAQYLQKLSTVLVPVKYL